MRQLSSSWLSHPGQGLVLRQPGCVAKDCIMIFDKALIHAFCGLSLVVLCSCKEENDKKDTEPEVIDTTQMAAADAVLFGESILEAKSSSQIKGSAIFGKLENGMKIAVRISGGTPGKLAMHIHEKGDCSADGASSAGGHFNPTGGQHSSPDHEQRHAGDLGNIMVSADGTGELTANISNINRFSDWSSIIGKSVVIHEKADDFRTQPSGDSGKRIACGVIKPTVGP